MCQVLSRQFCLVGPDFDFQFKFIETASESCVGSGKVTECAGDAGAEDAGVGAGEKPASAYAEGG